MTEFADPLAAATAETVRLHHAVEVWFRGTMPQDGFESEIADSMHPNFEIVFPAGTLLTRAQLLEPIRAGHGSNPDFRIAIEEPRVLGTWPGLILAGYVEHQTGARASAPENRRRSTALFETGPRLLWRHLHETNLPL